MKPGITAAIALLTVSCAEPRYGLVPLTRDRAIPLALAEFHRRGIAVSPRWHIKAFADVHIPELHPEVPIYVVEFYDPAQSTAYPLYIVSFHRYTWELDSFSRIDLPVHSQAVPHNRSNHSMKPTSPLRNDLNVFATTPCRGLSVSR